MMEMPPWRSAVKLLIDNGLKARLDAVGRYEVLKKSLLDRLLKSPTVLLWAHPEGLRNDFVPLQLRMALDADNVRFASALTCLLDDYEEFRGQLPDYIPQLQTYLVELFRGCYAKELPPSERAAYLGPDLKVSNEAILRAVREGEVGLGWEFGKLRRTVWFRVDWDDEHGATVEFDPNGNIVRPWHPTD